MIVSSSSIFVNEDPNRSTHGQADQPTSDGLFCVSLSQLLGPSTDRRTDSEAEVFSSLRAVRMELDGLTHSPIYTTGKMVEGYLVVGFEGVEDDELAVFANHGRGRVALLSRAIGGDSEVRNYSCRRFDLLVFASIASSFTGL